MKLIILSLPIIVMLFLCCGLSPVKSEPSGNQPEPVIPDNTSLTLTTTESSTAVAVFKNPDKSTYEKGDTVLLTVIAGYGYSFAGWSGDVVSKKDTLEIVMNKNTVINADVVNTTTGKMVYNIKTQSKNGTMTITPGGGIYDVGTTVTAYVKPDYGARFAGWSGAYTGSDSVAAFVVTKNNSLIANYTIDPSVPLTTVTISPLPVHGKLDFNPEGIPVAGGFAFKPGTMVTVTADADTGYKLLHWGAAPVSSGLQQSFTMRTDSNMTISAVFSKLANGLVWTNQNVTLGAMRSVIWTGSSSGSVSGQFVVVGLGGLIATSSDAKAWTQMAVETKSAFRSVAFANNMLVAVGDSIATSNDGVHWVVRPSGVTELMNAVTWTGKQFVAVGGNYANNSNRVITSPDGITWTDRGAIYDGIFYSVTWTGSKLVVAGTSTNNLTPYRSVVLNSVDGITWGASDFAHNGCNVYWDLRSVVWTDSIAIAVGLGIGTEGGSQYEFAKSDLSWNIIGLPVNGYFYSSTWTGTNLVIVGANGRIVISPPEQLYGCELVSSGTSSTLYSVVWTGKKLVAVGDGVVLTSQ